MWKKLNKYFVITLELNAEICAGVSTLPENDLDKANCYFYQIGLKIIT